MRPTSPAELYDRLLTADPPVCAAGKAVAVLQQCERRRRDQECLCRFDANEIAEDAAGLGCAEVGEYVSGELEPDDVEDFARAVAACLDDRSSGTAATDPDGVAAAMERLRRVEGRLGVLVRHEAGLTDRYSDDIDP